VERAVKHILRNLLSCAIVAVLAVASVAEARGARGVRSVSRSDVNVNRGGNINRNYNANVNVNRDVNVNVHNDYHGGYGYGGCCYHPVATAAAVTATAVVTSAVIGSIVYSLPPACSAVYVNGITYQQCGSTWYQPQFSGGNTTYVVVNAPR
jgi:hypothetical protein